MRLPAWAAAAVLVAAALALYWSGLRNSLVFDDYHLREYALRTRYSEAAWNLGMRWVSDASFGWVYAAFGRDMLWQRLLNALLHGAVAVSLFALVARLSGSRWLALGGAALFVVHPVAVYGTGYLMQRSIVLATLFSLLSLICVLRALNSERKTWWYIASLCAYFLAVYSKEHAIMLPAVAIAVVLLHRTLSPFLVRAIFLAAIPCALIGASLVLRQRGIFGATYEPLAADALEAVVRQEEAGPALYLLSVLNQTLLFFRYLMTWIVPWPGWMSIDFRTPFPRSLEPAYLAAALAWLAWPAIGAWLLLRRGRAGLAGFAMLFPWLMALTEVVAVRVQEPFVLYRSYLWMSVPTALLPALFSPAVAPRALAVAVIVACVALVPVARERLDSLSSNLKVAEDAVRKIAYPDAPYVERVYFGRGLAYLDARRLADAERDFARALELNPRLPEGYAGRATVHLRSGRFAEAEADLNRALELDPNYRGALGKRCVVRLAASRFAEALADCEKAHPLDPHNAELWINSGVAYRELGRRAEAEKSYRRALEIAPGNSSAHYNYGILLHDTGRPEAKQHLELACRARIAMACKLVN